VANPGTLAPGQSSFQVTALGQTRNVLLYAPSAVSMRPLPLVVALHGNGDDAANFMASNGLAQRADQLGFILAVPEAVPQFIAAAGTTLDWDAYSDEASNYDLAAVDAIKMQVMATGSVDAQHVVVFGYSQGGYMAFLVGMWRSTQYSCAAVAAASAPRSGLVGNAARPIPFSSQIGTSDYGINNARATHTALLNAGHPVDYHEVQGAGHVPFPGSPSVPLAECLARSL
jgi:polyhydroxybutyrate depolymerase